MDGPVSLIGGCALVDAVWTAVGEDPLTDVYGVLVPALDAAVSGLDGQVAADAIIGAFSTEYRCDQPGDDDVLGRIKRYTGERAGESRHRWRRAARGHPPGGTAAAGRPRPALPQRLGLAPPASRLKSPASPSVPATAALR